MSGMETAPDPKVVIIGAGPAGVRAAEVLVQTGLRPVVIDEGSRCGGQIYRQPPDSRKRPYEKLYGAEAPFARAIHETFDRLRSSIDYHPNTLAFDLADGWVSIHDRASQATGKVPYTHVILATGATDRVMPVKGWTTPGVYTLGASQIALKAQHCLIGQRVCFIGTGPLLYLIAVQYAQAGADVVAVVDSATRADQIRHAAGLRHSLRNAWRGMRFMAVLRARGIPVLKDARPVAIEGDGTVERVIVSHKGQTRTFACDAVGLGYGLRSESQLADLAGVPRVFDPVQQNWAPRSDLSGKTPVAGVYVAGDGAGILGAHAAEARGARAALALLSDLGRPVASDQAAALERDITRWTRFRRAIDGMFPIPVGALGTLDDDVVVCRCERITVGDLKRVLDLAGPEDLNRLKAFSRAGMGRCQGRYCGENVQAILATLRGDPLAQPGVHRAQAPIKPVPMTDMMRSLDGVEPLVEEGRS